MTNALTLFRETRAAPIGTVTILTDGEDRLRVLDFDDYAERMARLLDRYCGRGGWHIENAPKPTTAGRAIAAYFDGEVGAIDQLATATGGSAFQRLVWTALRGVPAGATVTYGAIAARIGQPTASRAVGMANGSNPIAIVVPCHRIIGGSGALTGYGGGLERKRWLLAHEARHVGRSGLFEARPGNCVCS